MYEPCVSIKMRSAPQGNKLRPWHCNEMRGVSSGNQGAGGLKRRVNDGCTSERQMEAEHGRGLLQTGLTRNETYHRHSFQINDVNSTCFR